MHMYESYGYDMKHGRVIAFLMTATCEKNPTEAKTAYLMQN